MSWSPPIRTEGRALRAQLPEEGWRVAITEIAEEHGITASELTPYAMGETIVWRVGQYVIKLTIPECAYQIEAEVGCLQATRGKLSITTPRLHARGALAGWPYVIMERVEGLPLVEVWPELDHASRLHLAQKLGAVCRELHSLPLDGFPGGWSTFWRTVSSNVGARHSAHGGPQALLASIDPFLEKVGSLSDPQLVPLHTELTDQHLYVREIRGQLELSAVIDFADARVGAPHYEFGALADFIFRGEPGLLREFLLAYGIPASRLTPAYSEVLLAWSLCHRFANLSRTLAALEPPVPSSLEELAQRRYSVTSA